MAESIQSLNMTKSEDLMTERVVGLENIQIQIPKNLPTTSNSEGSAKEKEQHSSRPVDNVPNTEDEKMVEKRRRIGVVKANDTVQAERMKARVMSKKFGTGMIPKKLSIFNKKLWKYTDSRCVPVETRQSLRSENRIAFQFFSTSTVTK